MIAMIGTAVVLSYDTKFELTSAAPIDDGSGAAPQVGALAQAIDDLGDVEDPAGPSGSAGADPFRSLATATTLEPEAESPTTTRPSSTTTRRTAVAPVAIKPTTTTEPTTTSRSSSTEAPTTTLPPVSSTTSSTTESTTTTTTTTTTQPPNRDPNVDKPGNQNSYEDEAESLTLSADDPDDDTLIFSASGLPPGLAIDSSTGVISGTPSSKGDYTVTVTVDDGEGGTDAVDFTWKVRKQRNDDD